MWSTNANQYWKEKERNDANLRNARRKRRLILAGSFIVVLSSVAFLLTWFTNSGPLAPLLKHTTSFSDDAVSGTRPPDRKRDSITMDERNLCSSKCVEQVIQQCHDDCTPLKLELPRPTIYQACQRPCVEAGRNRCQFFLGNPTSNAKQCEHTHGSVCQNICKGYQQKLPKPRMYGVCQIGCQYAKTGCKFADQCQQRLLSGEL